LLAKAGKMYFCYYKVMYCGLVQSVGIETGFLKRGFIHLVGQRNRPALTPLGEIRFSTALASFAGKVPANPAGHGMEVRWLKILGL
jgi:hypothetical protein